MGAPADAAPQLMQLGQTEMLRVFDEHHRGIGHIDPHLDQRSGDQHLDFIRAESRHRQFLFRRFDAAMQKAGLEWGQGLFDCFKFLRHGLDVLIRVHHIHARINDISLPPRSDLLADEFKYLRQFFRGPHKRLDTPASRRQFINHRDIQVTVKRQSQRARNGRGRHHQQMRVIAFAHECLALGHAELVLFVNDHQAELRQLKAVGEQSVGANVQGAGFAGGRGVIRFLAAGLEGQINAERRKPLVKIPVVLLRENFRGRHESDIETAFQCHQRAARRHRRFAGSDIPLQEPAHRMFAAEVRPDFAQHTGLRAGQFEAERRQKRFHQAVVTAAGQGPGIDLKFFPARLNLNLQGSELIQCQPLTADFHVRQFLGKMYHVNRIGARGQAGEKRQVAGGALFPSR